MLLLIGTLPIIINAILAHQPSSASSAGTGGKANNGGRSWPHDSNVYVRAAIPEDYAVGRREALQATTVFVRDVVVSNTDPNLTNTDMFGDEETTIAINPANLSEIVISAFSGSWGANAPIWHSADGGNTWTKRFTVPVPTGLGPGCPCDQGFDYGRGNLLSGTFLKTDVYSGTTSDPTSSAAWGWLTSMGVAVRTNSTGIGDVDQPWLLVNRDTANASQDNVYVAYDDFSMLPRGMQIAVAQGSNPPNFTTDNSAGTSLNCIGGNCVNPGHRLAVDPRNGYVYSLFQDLVTGDLGGFFNLNYMLNRTTDGGSTWGLNASPTGIVVANADTTQASPKFGTVNALLGGIDHATVDPGNGDVYYVYGTRDSVTFNNRLSIIRLTDDGMGGLTIGAPHFVTGQVQAALPSVAVTSNGTVGVLYTTFDGFSGGLPQFTAHFATSTDQGTSFTDNTLLTFLSSAPDNGDPGQRVLGDYNQVKAVDTCFYGAFTGNGVPFGRPFANHDPIFFRVCVGEADLAITKTDSPDPVITGNDLTYTVTVNNNGPDTATSVTVTDNLPAETTFVSCSSTGGGVCGGSGNNRTVTFASLASGQSETITFVANVSCSVADGTAISNTASVSSFTPDPDVANNSATASTTASNPPPTITGATADPSVLWPPNHRMVNVTISYDVTDNCALPPDSCTLSVTSNEPVLGHGSGHTSPDWIVVDDHHVLLRAERQGNGNGRIYTITITCTDSGGNSSSEQVEVTVPHDRGR